MSEQMRVSKAFAGYIKRTKKRLNKATGANLSIKEVTDILAKQPSVVVVTTRKKRPYISITNGLLDLER